MHFEQTSLKVYIFYADRFLCVLKIKPRNELLLATHDCYILLNTFDSQVSNKTKAFSTRTLPIIK